MTEPGGSDGGIDWLARHPWATSAVRIAPEDFSAGTRPRSEWGDGPWQEEADVIRWTSEAGYPAAIGRSPVSGALTGYVSVPEDHPYHGKKCSAVEQGSEAHGGLTFSGQLMPQYFGEAWWIGFDASHAWDYQPAMEALLNELHQPRHWPRYAAQGQEVPPPFCGLGGTYRTVDYVRGEVETLSRELRAAAQGADMLSAALAEKITLEGEE